MIPIDAGNTIQEMNCAYDVLIAVCHMEVGNSISAADTSVLEVAKACPGIDVIIAAHENNEVNEEIDNHILLFENKSMGTTMADITLEFKKEGDSFTLQSMQAEMIHLNSYEPGPEIEALMADYDRQAKEDSRMTIGTARMKDGYVFHEADVPSYDSAGIVSKEMVCDTPIIDLIQRAGCLFLGFFMKMYQADSFFLYY